MTTHAHERRPDPLGRRGFFSRFAATLANVPGRWRDPPTTGEKAERLVAGHLRKRGYRIVARNLRSRIGEIDIVAEAPDRRTIAIVEVKGSASEHADPPPEAHVNAAKQHKLTALASALVQKHPLQDRPVRFDVTGVNLPPGGKAVVRYHEGAFEAKS